MKYVNSPVRELIEMQWLVFEIRHVYRRAQSPIMRLFSFAVRFKSQGISAGIAC
jgi:hypothetical protein